jgi:hypothetical protein
MRLEATPSGDTMTLGDNMTPWGNTRWTQRVKNQRPELPKPPTPRVLSPSSPSSHSMDS